MTEASADIWEVMSTARTIRRPLAEFVNLDPWDNAADGLVTSS
ncbi:hypothetical protein [Mycobacterium arosiense]|nr:hypothetical protein [Mycobacterium arosiense]